jgi:hypothetical protein
MRSFLKPLLALLTAFLALLLLHLPLLRLLFYWDEAGYYIPAALDFYRSWSLIPTSTPPIGHTPLVMIYLGLAWRVFGLGGARRYNADRGGDGHSAVCVGAAGG